jgi:hypothetical protein
MQAFIHRQLSGGFLPLFHQLADFALFRQLRIKRA